jgi:Mn-dependent DtxR family transcriptional regulator
MEQLLSVSIQDYLKHIHELTETGGSASRNALAKKLKISAPSINGMIRKMGHPFRDPHGELIPTAELKMPLERSTPLSALRPNQTARIQSVRRCCAFWRARDWFPAQELRSSLIRPSIKI